VRRHPRSVLKGATECFIDGGQDLLRCGLVFAPRRWLTSFLAAQHRSPRVAFMFPSGYHAVTPTRRQPSPSITPASTSCKSPGVIPPAQSAALRLAWSKSASCALIPLTRFFPGYFRPCGLCVPPVACPDDDKSACSSAHSAQAQGCFAPSRVYPAASITSAGTSCCMRFAWLCHTAPRNVFPCMLGLVLL